MSDLRERVLSANPLDRVLQLYGVEIPSAKSRVDLRCCLPGHEDQDPSFSADLNSGLWYCFGCGRGGTAFDLVMQMEGVDFVESLRRLAERGGIPLVEQSREQIERHTRLGAERKTVFQIWEVAVAYYESRLTDEHRDFLRSSYGFSDETVARFRIGFADGGLLTHMKKRFSIDDLLLAGLLRRDEQGKVGDWFRNRIIFPILVRGEVVDIAGRRLGPSKSDGPPKHSTRTP